MASNRPAGESEGARGDRPSRLGLQAELERAGLLADPNLDPAHLVALVKIGFNKAVCWPSVEAIKNKYYELFRSRGAI